MKKQPALKVLASLTTRGIKVELLEIASTNLADRYKVHWSSAKNAINEVVAKVPDNKKYLLNTSTSLKLSIRRFGILCRAAQDPQLTFEKH